MQDLRSKRFIKLTWALVGAIDLNLDKVKSFLIAATSF